MDCKKNVEKIAEIGKNANIKFGWFMEKLFIVILDKTLKKNHGMVTGYREEEDT